MKRENKLSGTVADSSPQAASSWGLRGARDLLDRKGTTSQKRESFRPENKGVGGRGGSEYYVAYQRASATLYIQGMGGKGHGGEGGVTGEKGA